MSNKLIDLQHISKSYDGVTILDDLNSVIASVIYERKTVKDNNELAQSDSNQTA